MATFQEIAVGNGINENNEKIFREFVEVFDEFITFVSGPQTALLNKKILRRRETNHF